MKSFFLFFACAALAAQEPSPQKWMACLDKKASEALGVAIDGAEYQKSCDALTHVFRQGAALAAIEGVLAKAQARVRDCAMHKEAIGEGVLITFTVECVYEGEWFAYAFDFRFNKERKLQSITYGISSGSNEAEKGGGPHKSN